MYFLWKRWSRAGYLPPWFYALLGAGFVASRRIGATPESPPASDAARKPARPDKE